MIDWEKIKEKSSFDNGELIQVCFADEHIKELELFLLKYVDWDSVAGKDEQWLLALHEKHNPDNYT